jgi:hypothetical protein
LNGRDLNGRALRVDFADNSRINMPGDAQPPVSSSQPGRPISSGTTQKPSQPQQENIQPQNQDPIAIALSQIPKSQLYDAIAQMKVY